MTVKRRRPYSSETRAAAADATRARIVAASRTLLAERADLSAFSLEAVAREAGVTRLTVYNQFESRRGLLEAVFDDIARRGGLFDLPSVMADPDVLAALRRFVAVFCKFWASHDRVHAKLSAMTKLDEDIAASLKQRTERRRLALSALVNRMPGVREPADLIDVLFAFTSFQFFDQLSVRKRSAAAVEALIWQLVEEAVSRHSR